MFKWLNEFGYTVLLRAQQPMHHTRLQAAPRPHSPGGDGNTVLNCLARPHARASC